MGNFITGLGNNFAGFGFNHIVGKELTDKLLICNLIKFQTVVNQFLSHTRCKFFAFFQNGFAGFGIDQIKLKLNAFQALWIKLGFPTFFICHVSNFIIEIIKDFFFIHTLDIVAVNNLSFFSQLGNFLFCFFRIERIKDRCYRQFTAAVNTCIDQIFGIKFKIEPRTAIRDNAGSKQILTGRNGFAFIMVKEHARRAVHLRNNNALSSVKDKSSFICHQRNIAHIDILFLNIMDRFCAGHFIGIPNNQTQGCFDGSSIGHITFDTFINVIFRLFEFIFNKLQLAVAGKIFNWEN